MSQTFAQLADGDTPGPASWDSFTCCDQPARVAHATETLPIPGAVCETCWCTVTSLPGYGPITVSRCARHRS